MSIASNKCKQTSSPLEQQQQHSTVLLDIIMSLFANNLLDIAGEVSIMSSGWAQSGWKCTGRESNLDKWSKGHPTIRPSIFCLDIQCCLSFVALFGSHLAACSSFLSPRCLSSLLWWRSSWWAFVVERPGCCSCCCRLLCLCPRVLLDYLRLPGVLKCSSESCWDSWTQTRVALATFG